MNWWQGLLFFGLTSPLLFACVCLLLAFLLATVVSDKQVDEKSESLANATMLIGACAVLAWWGLYFLAVLKW